MRNNNYLIDTKALTIMWAKDMRYITIYGFGLTFIRKDHVFIMGWSKYSTAPKIIIGDWCIQILRPFKYEKWW